MSQMKQMYTGAVAELNSDALESVSGSANTRRTTSTVGELSLGAYTVTIPGVYSGNDHFTHDIRDRS